MSLFAAAAAPELECKICYEAFDGRERRPKLLGCQHRVCVRCLRRMAKAGELSGEGDGGGGGGALSCPFCRRETPLPEKDVARLPDDGPALALLLDSRRPLRREEAGRGGRAGSAPLAPEVLLCPGAVPEASAGVGSASSECLVVTVLEVPAEDKAAAAAAAPGSLLEVMRLYRRASLASVRCYSPLGKRPLRPGRAGAWRGLARFLLAFLALLYFSSLPFGVYLLLVERLQLGIVLVSLVPSTLLLCLFYSLCQCLCHEIFHPPS